jgi:diguanylate cyclase (GGDEF)-like protein/PAS domain S-box-containing protein
MVGITALVLTRQLVSFHDNARLLSSLDASLLELRRQEERFRSLVQYGSDITVVDGEEGITYVSPSLLRVMGIDPEALTSEVLRALLHPDDAAMFGELELAVRASHGRTGSTQVRVRHADGGWRTLDVNAANMLDNPSVHGIVYNARDVTEARELQDRLRHEATHDALTHLANRALFDERVRMGDRRTGAIAGLVTVLAIDLDDFKQVNDEYGHHVGDALLVAVADRLRACVRPGDTVARLGGDEFAVLLPGTPPEYARQLADRMVSELAVPVPVGRHHLSIKASLGIASGHWQDADALLREADAAMYRVKHSGKGGYAFAAA